MLKYTVAITCLICHQDIRTVESPWLAEDRAALNRWIGEQVHGALEAHEPHLAACRIEVEVYPSEAQ